MTLAMAVFPALLLHGGCIVTTHHARVRPGWSGRIMAGARDEKLGPPSEYAGWEYDDTGTGKVSLQADFGYGKRFSPNRAFYGGVIVPLAMHDGSVPGSLAATSLDLYFQVLGRPFNAGAGLFGGLPVQGAYIEIGKSFHRGKDVEIEVSAGVSREIFFLKDPAYRYFAVASYEFRKMEIGIFADLLSADDVIKRCDEECYSNDYLERSWIVGLMMGWKFD